MSPSINTVVVIKIKFFFLGQKRKQCKNALCYIRKIQGPKKRKQTKKTLQNNVVEKPSSQKYS